MLPDIDLRIDNMLKALEQVVIPALPSGERLARDQVNLVIGHLRMMKDQWRFAVKFEAGSLENMMRLGDELADQVDPIYRQSLADALSVARNTDSDDQKALATAIHDLGSVIDRIILGEDGRLALAPAAFAAIIDYGHRQARRERSWFAATGLDPDRAELPTIAQTMSAAS
ncbi:hypothetical protein HZF05_15650 [Sphingomonas sp. CGMCC 1.13654]|uniref:Uncharacterized protein n=1 Tax=Sphingomonas chungangi TaxID=2683589 RepID=A0A838L891_9SPHN|nr:hypothetical protein [Sphingomonas chungangi]MBA2935521.1 hypothetical protein [Sphingomonas chungangi]MVW57028.1 hypothetical protein [Sphingomonas chungangi]